MIFDRGQLTEIWLRLESGEALGVLQSGYIQDAYGTDGQVTLEHVSSGTRWAVMVVEDAADLGTHTVFQGHLPLSSIPDGSFRLHAKCRDPIGNYTAIGTVVDTSNISRFLVLGFTVVSEHDAETLATSLIVTLPALTLQLQTAVSIPPAIGHTPVGPLGSPARVQATTAHNLNATTTIITFPLQLPAITTQTTRLPASVQTQLPATAHVQSVQQSPALVDLAIQLSLPSLLMPSIRTPLSSRLSVQTLLPKNTASSVEVTKNERWPVRLTFNYRLSG